MKFDDSRDADDAIAGADGKVSRSRVQVSFDCQLAVSPGEVSGAPLCCLSGRASRHRPVTGFCQQRLFTARTMFTAQSRLSWVWHALQLLSGRNLKCNMAKYPRGGGAFRGGFRGGPRGSFRGRSAFTSLVHTHALDLVV